ncbi:hypothetical protein Tco_1160925 [Tanacetum coccineum]
MADHSKKWHDGTTSKNIGRNTSKDGLAALVNKLDNLGRDMKKLKERASVNVLPRKIFKYLKLTNLSETEMLVEMADMRKKAPLGIVKDTVWSERYSEWCNENSHDEKPRPRDYTFKEWVKHKKGHLYISKSVRKDLFRLWVIDKFTETLDPDKDPLERCLDEYNWVFPKEIEQLADEYEIKIGEKGQVHEEIWTRCKRARCKNKDWCFICVNGENNETPSSGRKNGSRFRKMIMEEMEEVLRNDGEDSDNDT